jgi:hypothetical protein
VGLFELSGLLLRIDIPAQSRRRLRFHSWFAGRTLRLNRHCSPFSQEGHAQRSLIGLAVGLLIAANGGKSDDSFLRLGFIAGAIAGAIYGLVTNKKR